MAAAPPPDAPTRAPRAAVLIRTMRHAAAVLWWRRRRPQPGAGQRCGDAPPPSGCQQQQNTPAAAAYHGSGGNRRWRLGRPCHTCMSPAACIGAQQSRTTMSAPSPAPSCSSPAAPGPCSGCCALSNQSITPGTSQPTTTLRRALAASTAAARPSTAAGCGSKPAAAAAAALAAAPLPPPAAACASSPGRPAPEWRVSSSGACVTWCPSGVAITHSCSAASADAHTSSAMTSRKRPGRAHAIAATLSTYWCSGESGPAGQQSNATVSSRHALTCKLLQGARARRCSCRRRSE